MSKIAALSLVIALGAGFSQEVGLTPHENTIATPEMLAALAAAEAAR